MLSAALISGFILASSGLLLFFWFRQVCRSILGQGCVDQVRDETRDSQLKLLAIRRALPDYTIAGGSLPAQLEAIEQCYKAYTYLLRKTSGGRFKQHSFSERLLILDFQLLRSWARARSFLSVSAWSSCFPEMTTILKYFQNLLEWRLIHAIGFFEPSPVRAGAASPLLTMCTYCRNVRDDGGAWVTPRRYHKMGGNASVGLTHGICPDCYETFVRPMLLARPSQG
ncbi:MAG: hypothetical protein ACE5HB_02255 [Terriglobia bacterium]